MKSFLFQTVINDLLPVVRATYATPLFFLKMEEGLLFLFKSKGHVGPFHYLWCNSRDWLILREVQLGRYRKYIPFLHLITNFFRVRKIELDFHLCLCS